MELLTGRSGPGTLEQAAYLDEIPRIIHVVGSLQGGGAERCVRELVPRLRARGSIVEIATVYSPNLAPETLAELGCDVFTRPKRRGFDPVHLAWLARTIARRNPAIVHTHMQAGKYVGRLAAMLARVPIIVHTEHSPNPLKSSERLYIDFFWRRTSAVVTFGERNAEIVRRRERVRRFEIIRNGVEIRPVPSPTERAAARRRMGIDDPETVIFAIVASLQERKNHRLALTALAELARVPGVPVHLALFGDGALRPDLEALASSLGIAHLVRFHGFEPDVARMLPGVDVIASASTLEMAPVSLLEGMVACLPIVATPHPGTEDMIEDGITGFVTGWDVTSFAAALQRARADRAWREAAGAAGRARVARNHDIETIADQHHELYRHLLREARTRGRP